MKHIATLVCILIVLSSCSFFSEETEITQGIYFFPLGLDPAENTNFFEYQIFSIFASDESTAQLILVPGH